MTFLFRQGHDAGHASGKGVGIRGERGGVRFRPCSDVGLSFRNGVRGGRALGLTMTGLR